jgi:hypothetical protein
MVWLRTCLSGRVILPVASSPQFAPQFAPNQTMAIPMRTATPGKPVAAGDIGKAIGKAGAAAVQATAKAPAQNDTPSAFNQLIAQIVAESGDPETGSAPAVPVPAAAAQTIKLPPKSTGASTTTSNDPSSELPAPFGTAPAPLPETSAAAPAGGRRADTRSAAPSSAGNAQPPSLSVDVNIPIPIAPKLPLLTFEAGGSIEHKPTAVSSAEETAPIRLAPQPILDLKIHLNEPAPAVQSTVASAVITTQAVSASAPSSATQGTQEETAGQQNPQRGSPDPGDPDTGPATEAIGHPVPRTSANQEAVALVQPQRPDAGSTQPVAHDSAAVPVGALPAPSMPALAPMTARDATPEPAAGNAPLREESTVDQTKTQHSLRSLAIEFSPDGAGDIKVRLSERAGDVHISLHGTDPSLAGRVREGVGDLVGSLSKAGYDAEAWTPGQGRQNQRQQPDQRQPARDSSFRGPDAEEFSGIFQQPIQEIS